MHVLRHGYCAPYPDGGIHACCRSHPAPVGHPLTTSPQRPVMHLPWFPSLLSPPFPALCPRCVIMLFPRCMWCAPAGAAAELPPLERLKGAVDAALGKRRQEVTTQRKEAHEAGGCALISCPVSSVWWQERLFVDCCLLLCGSCAAG